MKPKLKKNIFKDASLTTYSLKLSASHLYNMYSMAVAVGLCVWLAGKDGHVTCCVWQQEQLIEETSRNVLVSAAIHTSISGRVADARVRLGLHCSILPDANARLGNKQWLN